MVTWMPPVLHVTGMSERLWQIAERLLELGYEVLSVSEMCSAFHRENKADLDPRVTRLACGPSLAAATPTRLLAAIPVEHVLVASWWFDHPLRRSLPEIWIPQVRELQPWAAVTVLADDVFVPDPRPYASPVPPDQVGLVSVCGAQTVVFAAADGVGTLTGEDAEILRRLMPLHACPLPVHRIRYSVSVPSEGRPQPRANPTSTIEGFSTLDSAFSHGADGGSVPLPGPSPAPRNARAKQFLYIGSCQSANEVGLRWLLADVLPLLDQALAERGESPEEWRLAIVGNVTPRTCAPALCADGVCDSTSVAVVFLGYVEHLGDVIDASAALLAPRISGLGLATKLMLGFERGLPVVSNPHGLTGYNMSRLDGSQGALVAPHEQPQAFAEAAARLVTDDDLWEQAAAGGRRHVWGQFNAAGQRSDVSGLLAAAAARRRWRLLGEC